MYHKRVTRTPRSVDAIICSTVCGFCGVSEHNIQRHLSHFIGQGKTVTRRLDRTDFILVFRLLHSLRGGARIDNLLHYSVFDQGHPLPLTPSPSNGEPGLQRMSNIVPDGDVVAE